MCTSSTFVQVSQQFESICLAVSSGTKSHRTFIISTVASTKLEPAQINLPQQQRSEKAIFQVETRWDIGLMIFV